MNIIIETKLTDLSSRSDPQGHAAVGLLGGRFAGKKSSLGWGGSSLVDCLLACIKPWI